MIFALALLLAGDPCWQHEACTGTRWELRINGVAVDGLGDMTKDQCGAAYNQIEPQTPPFTLVQCVETNISRQDG